MYFWQRGPPAYNSDREKWTQAMECVLIADDKNLYYRRIADGRE
jgi:hypothetical protein